MHANNQLIHTFFEAFQQKDCETMQSLYADQATFSDPVFYNLNHLQLKGMWEMFCKRSKDLQIEFHHSTADDQSGSATWHAMYTFSPTGQGVINKIQSEFTFQDGKILTHKDSFSFYNWARQALGWKGLLFGWTPMIQNKVRRMANASLDRFLSWKEAEG